MTIRLTFLMLFALSFVGITEGRAQSSDPKLLAVKFHADWCKSCRAMGSAFEDLQNAVSDQPIEFVLLDFTDENTRAQADQKVEEHGLTDLIKKHAGTGFILLVDNDEKKVKKILNKKHSHDQMVKAVTGYLQQ